MLKPAGIGGSGIVNIPCQVPGVQQIRYLVRHTRVSLVDEPGEDCGGP
jgi:hypothetical protein